MSKFATKVAAKIKGDDALATGKKIESKVKALLASQVSLLETKKVDLQLSLGDAEETLEDALYPTTTPVNGETYLKGVRAAKAVIENYEESIEEVEDSIKFYQGILKSEFGAESAS